MDNFQQICEKMHSIYLAKNHDYGSSFDKSCDEFGLISPAIRLQDKLNRFKSLITANCTSDKAQVLDESINDTLLDLANYAILTILWNQGHDLSSNS